MLPPQTIIAILLFFSACGSVIRIVAGAASIERTQENKPRYDLADVIFGLLNLGAVITVVML